MINLDKCMHISRREIKYARIIRLKYVDCGRLFVNYDALDVWLYHWTNYAARSNLVRVINGVSSSCRVGVN
jgi:hypothetical protein